MERIYADPGDVRGWWLNRIGQRLCEGRESAVFSYADAKERLRVYLGKWAHLKEDLRVFYYRDVKRGPKGSFYEVPRGEDVFVQDIDTGSFIAHTGLEVPFGKLDPNEFIWARRAVEVKVYQHAYSSTITLMPKAADVKHGEATGYCAMLELLYSLEPEGFEVLEAIRGLENSPMGRPFLGSFLAYHVGTGLRAGDQLMGKSISTLGEEVLEAVRSAKFPKFPSRARSVRVYPSEQAARTALKQRFDFGEVYVVNVFGNMSRHDPTIARDVLKIVSTDPQTASEGANEYWSGVAYSDFTEVLVEGRVKVVGKMERRAG